jgi:ribulose-5-phosphate 4-epimerase/fuculose-1-phosphate aldolase
LGYGNLSLRLPAETRPEGQPRFVITGSQTGRYADLGPEHFAVVVDWDIGENLVVARGPIQPSSETMTHAAIYGADEGIRCVMHAHSPDIWDRAHELGIPTTSSAAAYGTPAMAREVERVVHAAPTRRIVAMEGHEDGVLAWGASVEATGITLLTTFVQAMQHGL